MKLGAKELRISQPTGDDIQKIKRNPITIILDNVLDTYNVGAIFRLADAIAAEKIYLCGDTLTPPNPQIKKASVGTWQWVPWQYASSTSQAIQLLKTQNSKLTTIAVEQSAKSVPFHKIHYKFPLALVVGNETYGVSQEVLNLVDQIVEIPMWGVNKSLNVMVSMVIVLYEAMKQNDRKNVMLQM